MIYKWTFELPRQSQIMGEMFGFLSRDIYKHIAVHFFENSICCVGKRCIFLGLELPDNFTEA
jgi:hypothetical protein